MSPISGKLFDKLNKTEVQQLSWFQKIQTPILHGLLNQNLDFTEKFKGCKIVKAKFKKM